MTVSDRFSVSNYSHYQQFGHFTERGAQSGYGFNYAYHNETLPIYFISNSLGLTFTKNSDQPPIIESLKKISHRNLTNCAQYWERGVWIL